MEREGERPRIQGKSLNATSRRERSGEGVLFAGKLLSALLAVVLAAGLLPIVPASPVVEEAEALAGTTNYGDFFTIGAVGLVRSAETRCGARPLRTTGIMSIEIIAG